MTTTRRAATLTCWLLAGAAPALADTGARADHSGLLVWAFLGLCALIVLAQVVPSVVLLVELTRGAWEARRTARQTARR